MTGRRWWSIAASFFSGLLIAAAIRYGILDNEAQALMCRTEAALALCQMRSALGWAIYYQLFGLTALVLGIAGWLPRLRQMALPGLLLAGCGLLVYNTTYAAVASVLALLAGLQPSVSSKKHPPEET